ncbi:dihydroxy-acid dehydratase/phosphogluconate dehydratase [Rothia mucilaginosa DY-18]|uniref:Dihydroxy-acid dehydratase/phosphogluconate dehydratase n=1 Tax=Rothia mucilaginosa (strain DY-18) TaxID=680646 RepID=D2NT95_ROTMD|nr:dihydroxy-acid dehydratase/phosphogluconate dehydratase [Rothia mucilaginosa DY-18]
MGPENIGPRLLCGSRSRRCRGCGCRGARLRSSCARSRLSTLQGLRVLLGAQNINHEHEGARRLGTTGVVTVRQIRRDDQLNTGADLLALQTLSPTLDNALQGDAHRGGGVIVAVDDLTVGVLHTNVTHVHGVGFLDLGALALNEVLRDELSVLLLGVGQLNISLAGGLIQSEGRQRRVSLNSLTGCVLGQLRLHGVHLNVSCGTGRSGRSGHTRGAALLQNVGSVRERTANLNLLQGFVHLRCSLLQLIVNRQQNRLAGVSGTVKLAVGAVEHGSLNEHVVTIVDGLAVTFLNHVRGGARSGKGGREGRLRLSGRVLQGVLHLRQVAAGLRATCRQCKRESSRAGTENSELRAFGHSVILWGFL